MTVTIAERALARARPKEGGSRFLVVSGLVVGLLVVASWAAVVDADRVRGVDLLSARSASQLWEFLRDLAGVGPATAGRVPAFLNPASWVAALGLAGETLAMSVLAAAGAGVLALLTATLGARNIAYGDLAGQRSAAGRALAGGLFVLARGCYSLTRAIPELVWALLVVFVLNPGIVAGALALAIHNFGILGKLASEAIEDLDSRPLRALQRSGARSGQLLAYGVLPMLLPRFLTYLLYRWEVIIRTTIVVGVVGAGGLGREFRLAMSFFQYTDVTLLLIVYFLLVIGVDLASAGLRQLAK